MRNLVLTFHNVTDAIWFEKVLKIVKCFYHIGTIDQLYERLSGKMKNTPLWMCFLTFDDGEKSVFECVYPVIKKYQIPITLFVSPKNICQGGSFWFQRMRMLHCDSSIEEMKKLPLQQILHEIDKRDLLNKTDVDVNINIDMFHDMEHSGLVTYGAHTQHHPILSNETNDVAKSEIYDSISDLSKLLDYKVSYFAYPNGRICDFGEREKNLLKDCNIKMAFSTIVGFADDSDMYSIKRVGITKGNSLFITMKILCPTFFYKMKKILRG